MKENCAVIILAAGFSYRMGEPKPFLFFEEEHNITFLEKIVSDYHNFGCSKIIVVHNFKNIDKAKKHRTFEQIVVNNEPEKGRFLSLKLGIDIVEKEDFVFIDNIDNPVKNHETLELLWQNRNKNGYVSPRYKQKGGHPILISRNIITQIQREKAENQSLKTFLQPFDKQNVLTNDSSILLNINTKEEYNKLIN